MFGKALLHKFKNSLKQYDHGPSETNSIAGMVTKGNFVMENFLLNGTLTLI